MSRFNPFALLIAGALVLGVAPGCEMFDKDKDQKSEKADAKSGKKLWYRLGGEKAVTAVVDDFVGRAAPDPKVNFFRKGTPVEWKPTDAEVARFKRLLVEFISENTGGPLKYTGRPMATSHRGMKINNAEFDALAGHLSATLDKFKVQKTDKDELLKIVGSTRGEIVGK